MEGAAARTRGPSSTATAVVMARRRLGGCRCGWFAALDRAAGSDSSLFGCACLAGLELAGAGSVELKINAVR